MVSTQEKKNDFEIWDERLGMILISFEEKVTCRKSYIDQIIYCVRHINVQIC